MSGSVTPAITTYDFDAELQTEIVALMMWDHDFLRRTNGLINPAFVENEVERGFATLALNFYKTYGEAPSKVAWVQLIKDGFNVKPQVWRDDQKKAVVQMLGSSAALVIRSRSFLMDKILEFARQQEIENAMMASAADLGKTNDPKRFERIQERMGAALKLKLNDGDEDYNYFARVGDRTKTRLDIISAGRPLTGVTSGVAELDALLKHRGYGRKELALWMGGAKSTKSFNLSGAAAAAARDGKNVLLITLENSREVVCDRLDADFSDIATKDHLTTPHGVETAVNASALKCGLIEVREYPMGSFSPNDLEALVESYLTKGVTFDECVIDYVGIMRADEKHVEPRHKSEEIVRRVRSIGQKYNMAMVSAIQTNREGHKSATARAEHAAEDFNTIRIADLVISVNRTDEEKAADKARLFVAASRNSKDGCTLFVTQDLDKGRAVTSVESVE